MGFLRARDISDKSDGSSREVWTGDKSAKSAQTLAGVDRRRKLHRGRTSGAFLGGSAHMRRPPSITPLGKPHRNKPVNLSYDSAYCAGRVAYLANTRRRFEAKPNMCWQEFFFRNLLVFSMSLPIASLLRRLAPIVSSLILRLRLDGQLVFSYFELNCSSDVLARTTWM